MTLTRRIAHNTFIQVIGKILTTVIGIVVVGILTRYLGTEGYGQYTIVIAFLQFFAIILDLGLYIILIKRISEPHADIPSLVSNAFTLRIVSAVVILGLAPLIALVFPYPPEVMTGIAVTTLSFLFISLTQVLSGVFQKALRMDRMAIAEVVGRIILLGTSLVMVWLNAPLLGILVAVVVGSFTNFLITFLYARRLVPIRIAFNMPVWKGILAASWPIGISVALNLVYFKADTIILSVYQPANDVGIYGATFKVLEILATFPAMFAGLIMPLLSAAYAVGDRERFQRVLRKAFHFLFIVALPMVVGTQFIATSLMTAIADDAFAASGPVLRILITATGMIFLGTLFGNAIVAINKQRLIIFGYLVVAAVSIAGYFYFIPRFSYMGAAWMTLVSEAMIMLITGTIVLRSTHSRLDLSILWKGAIAAGAMAGVLSLMSNAHWTILIIVGMIVYAAVLYLVRGVSRDLIREVVRPE